MDYFILDMLLLNLKKYPPNPHPNPSQSNPHPNPSNPHPNPIQSAS